MLDRHNRRDFLKTSALAAIGSAAALTPKRGCLLLRLPARQPCPRPFTRAFRPASWGISM